MADKYKPIDIKSIEVLIRNGCRADDWSTVYATDGFNPARVLNTNFKGEVLLGKLDGEIESHDGIGIGCSISGANLNNVTIGDNCHIRNIHSWIMNMDIGENVLLVNVGSIVCSGETSFGNGSELEVLNEGGGRELKMTAETNAQMAYLHVMYRHRDRLVEKLDSIADEYAGRKRSTRGTIGNNAQITNSGRISNVCIGEYAMISGISSLEEGTVASSKEAPTTVENGVTAENFIFQEGAVVKDRAVLSSVLVGQASTIGSQFAAENSVFFANSEGFHSEACSVFAGPYTVTHHKSTLLIAGLFSFYNAGSGTNQSNHMYKLGPLHQGVMERGCKTGSFSYLLWPSRVGAFSAVLGKHYANFDTTDFPFSYIDNDGSKSILIPGMNYFTVGTLRDGAKWPKRDKRKAAHKRDRIIFDVLSPYTGQKMINGYRVLSDLYEKTEKSEEFVMYNGIHMKRLVLRTSRRYYTAALDKYMGDVLVKRVLEKGSVKDVFVSDAAGEPGDSFWIDVCGMLCTKPRIDRLCDQIESGEIGSYEKLYEALDTIVDGYSADEWNWVLEAYKELNATEMAEETEENLKAFFETWKKSSVKFYNMVLNDASKEFEGNVKLSFGIDGNAEEDFKAVRGTFEDNDFVKQVQQKITDTEEKLEKVLKLF